MYVPDIYRPDDSGWPLEIIRGNPLAILATNGPTVPFLTHLPIIPNPSNRAADDSSLIGTELLGHLNRANPHARALTDGQEAVAVFQGPHGYVSPTVYQTNPAAPTWNFTAVHVRGELRLIRGVDATLGVIHATVEALEGRLGQGWDMRPSFDYFRQIVPGVQAFALRVLAVDSMAKLSQEKSADVRDLVADAFTTSGSGRHRELAAMMREVGRPAPHLT